MWCLCFYVEGLSLNKIVSEALSRALPAHAGLCLDFPLYARRVGEPTYVLLASKQLSIGNLLL